MAIILQIHAFPPGAPTIYSLLSTSTSSPSTYNFPQRESHPYFQLLSILPTLLAMYDPFLVLSLLGS